MKELLNRKFLSLLSISFLSGVATAPSASLLAVYVEAELQRPPVFTAGLRSILLILGGIFAVPGGAMCDSLGIKQTYILGMTGALTAGFIFLVKDPLILFIMCLYGGISSGFQITASQSYLLGSAPSSSLGLGTAAFFLGSTLGTSIGNVIAGPIVDNLGFHVTGVTMVVAISIVFLCALFVMPSLPKIDNRARHSGFETMKRYLQIVRRRKVFLFLCVRFLPTCYWGTATLLIPLLIFRASGTKSSAAYYTALSLLVASAFQILTGRLIDKIGYRKPVIVASSSVTVSTLLTALFSKSTFGLYLFGTTGAAAAWSLSTTMPSLINDIAGEEEKGRVIGIAHLVWSLGMLSGNLGGGRLVELSSALPFFIATFLCVIAVTCALTLFHYETLHHS